MPKRFQSYIFPMGNIWGGCTKRIDMLSPDRHIWDLLWPLAYNSMFGLPNTSQVADVIDERPINTGGSGILESEYIRPSRELQSPMVTTAPIPGP